MALAGEDGRKAEQLLTAARKEGAAVLADVTRRALKRWLGQHGAETLLHADKLLNEGERKDLAEAIAATNATANLLGRSRIRLRQQRYQQHAEVAKFSDPTDFAIFDDAPLRPLAPEKAVDFFKRKQLLPGVNAKELSTAENKKAFTLAVDADAVLLDKIKQTIGAVLESGRQVSATPRMIGELLDSAGVAPANPQYSEMVFRTNMKASYAEGAQEELREVAASFPVWRYVGIADGRERHTDKDGNHRAHFDKYFPSSVDFTEIRDSIAVSPWNCRCDFIPVYISEWKRLRAAGARIADGYDDPVAA